MENKKMSIYYNLRTLEIKTCFQGIQTLEGYKGMSLEDAEMIYGILVIDFDKFILTHTEDFELTKDENETIALRMKKESIDNFKNFI